jgi:hypothetical protein
MRLQLKQFTTLAGMTAIETLRQPICLLLVATCVLFITILPFFLTHTMGEEGKLVRDSALAFHFVCGLVLGSYASCTSITREIRHGTAAAVLSKPVHRSTFFLAKFTGIGVVMLLFSAAVTIATLLSARAAAESFHIDWWAAGPLLAATPLAFALAGLKNYFTRQPFVSNAFGLLLFALVIAFVVTAFVGEDGAWGTFGSAVPWPIAPGSVLVTLAILVLCAIAAALSTRLDALSTLALCSVVFMVGLMSDYLFGRHAAASHVAAFFYAVIPNWQHFWAADALTAGGTVPWSYVARVGVYALLYLAGVLCLGILAFRRMEIKA